MDKLTGGSNVTLDDTGRISLPRKLRDILDTGKVNLTKGADPSSLWLFTPDQWDLFEKDLLDSTDHFSASGRRLRQHFIGDLQPVDIDGHGRILIPPTLRDHAGLSRDCRVLGQVDHIEIWDSIRYEAHLEASEDVFKTGLEEIGAVKRKKRDLGGYGNSSYSGAAGGDYPVSGAEGGA